MLFCCRVGVLLCAAQSAWTAATAGPVADIRTAVSSLHQVLSPGATISFNTSSDPRWSQYKAPSPGAIVNVVTEQDVVATVRMKCRILSPLETDGSAGEVL